MYKKLLLCLLVPLFFACEKENTSTFATQEDIDAAKEILNSEIVHSSKITVMGVDKTILPQGCPTKYQFSWGGETNNTLHVALEKFSVGNMPFTLDFSVDAEFYNLNIWEKDEYTEDGWLKFTGKNGKSKLSKGSLNIGYNGKIDGYINIFTQEIEFRIDFNIMGAKCFVFRQAIDNTRLENFDAEFAQYEHDLEEYKNNNGLK